jgi:FkbM family methyltransferase
VSPSARIRERLYNLAWRLLPRVRRSLDRAGILKLHLGKFSADRFLFRLGFRLVPPPSQDTWAALPTGQRLLIPKGHIPGRTYLTGSYEPEVTRFFLTAIGEGQVVVDIGANIGYYTLIASKLVGPSGKAYAFEPDPVHYGYLRENIRANRCSNVEAMQKAVTSGVEGEAPFWPEPNGSAGSLHSRPRTPPVVVRTISLDEFFARLGWPRVDFVKIDVEGAETEAIEGMAQVSERNPTLRMVTEFVDSSLRRSGTGPEEFFGTLGHAGFTRFLVLEENLRPLSLPGDLPWLLRQAEFRPINLLCEKETPSEG